MNSDRLAIRSVPAGHGADWIREGYARFRAAPLPWVAAFLALAALMAALSRGSDWIQLAGDLLLPVLTGGLMLGCQAQTRGEPFRFTHLFAGFENPPLKRLLALGLLSMAGFLLVALGVIAALGASIAGALVSGDGLAALQLGPSALIAMVVALLLLAPLTMALWFAPPLIAIHGLGAGQALLASLRAGRRNPGAMLVNGLLLLLIAVLATIPFGLGWLIAGPVTFASIHAGCRDLFDAAASESPSAG